MEIHESVAEMVQSYAAKAVTLAAERDRLLDYGEESLKRMEGILDEISKQQSPSDVSEICKIWGSYLGEVVRRRFGGDWSIETYPGKQFATLTLTVKGSRLFPSMKVHRRLTQGADESVWSFYQMVRARLESIPGARVQ
ncbi:MAG TPA: hypothetical protein VJN64_13405 [Terriglobales bacterium]|nr:hypothetical protein [Terriglobales bacterium]